MQGFWGGCGCQWIDRSILGSVSGAPALDTSLSRSGPVSLTHDVDRNCFPGRASESALRPLVLVIGRLSRRPASCPCD